MLLPCSCSSDFGLNRPNMHMHIQFWRWTPDRVQKAVSAPPRNNMLTFLRHSWSVVRHTQHNSFRCESRFGIRMREHSMQMKRQRLPRRLPREGRPVPRRHLPRHRERLPGGWRKVAGKFWEGSDKVARRLLRRGSSQALQGAAAAHAVCEAPHGRCCLRARLGVRGGAAPATRVVTCAARLT